MFNFGSYGLVCYDLTESAVGKAAAFAANPYGAALHRCRGRIVGASTIRGKTPICRRQSPRRSDGLERTAHRFSTDGQTPCNGVTTGSTRFSCRR